MLLVLFSVCFLINCFSQQPVQLHLKKNGRAKKRIELGSPVMLITKNKKLFAGPLIQLKRDSIYFSNAAVALKDIDRIKLPRNKNRRKFDWEEFGYVSFGVGLTTAGLVLANWSDFPGALGIASAIGYSPYLLRLLKSVSFKKRKFKIGHKYSLRIWEIR